MDTGLANYHLVLRPGEILGELKPKKLGIKEMPTRAKGDIVAVREGDNIDISGLKMEKGVIFFRVDEVVAGDRWTSNLDILILALADYRNQGGYREVANLCRKLR